MTYFDQPFDIGLDLPFPADPQPDKPAPKERDDIFLPEMFLTANHTYDGLRGQQVRVTHTWSWFGTPKTDDQDDRKKKRRRKGRRR